VRLPLVPVTVTVAAPRVAVAEAASVKVELVPVAGVGLNAAVTPAGNPVAVNVTLPAKAAIRLIPIVLVPLSPRLTVRLVGLVERAKSGAFTVRPIVVV